MRQTFITIAIALIFAVTALADGPGESHAQSGEDWPAKFIQILSEGRSDLSDEDRIRVQAVTEHASQFESAENFENKQGGGTTDSHAPNENAFSHFAANLTFAEQEQFNLGNALFRKIWVSSPASTLASDGLGPLFNARACQSCHLKDGRGRPPAHDEETAISMFLRLSVAPETDAQKAQLNTFDQAVIPHPTYGTQLQNFAVPGLPGEGQMRIAYTEEPFIFPDGDRAYLRKPTYSISDLAYGELGQETLVSPRVTQPMIGLGLLEAIHPADILTLADPDDLNNDGISGRPAIAKNPETGDLDLGRFGWKAGQATVRAQSAAAFAGDIGISTSLINSPYGDCTALQTACLAMPTGEQDHLGESEAPEPVLDLVTFYAQNLAVPQRRLSDDPNVLAGKKNFYAIGCTSCHTPKFVTRRDAVGDNLSFQLIWPYSDLLLHDMGEGLADNRPEGAANGQEWRTPPLWGIGLTQTVSGHTLFLHDGRARNLTEAILWHGGEAATAQSNFVALSANERQNVIAFLESL